MGHPAPGPARGPRKAPAYRQRSENDAILRSNDLHAHTSTKRLTLAKHLGRTNHLRCPSARKVSIRGLVHHPKIDGAACQVVRRHGALFQHRAERAQASVRARIPFGRKDSSLHSLRHRDGVNLTRAHLRYLEVLVSKLQTLDAQRCSCDGAASPAPCRLSPRRR